MKHEHPNFSSHLYFFGLVLLVIGLVFSKVLLSISQFILAVSWLTSGNLKEKLKSFLHNKTALIVCSLFLLHLLGLLYTVDFNYGLQDVRIKLPLLILPFIIATNEPLSKKKFEGLLLLFVSAVYISTLISSAVLTGIINRPINDIRDISIYMSHIRFGLLICLAIFITAYFLFSSQSGLKKVLFVLVIAWLLFFLIILESLTGLTILCATTVILLCYFTFKQKNILYKIIYISFAITIPVGVYSFVKKNIHEFYTYNPVDINTLQQVTANGNPYQHDIKNTDTENGNLIWLYVCRKELEEEWNLRSPVKFDAQDKRGQLIQYTLIRFLTSKGLRKDADGVKSLTDKEVHSIERGIANVNYQNITNLKARVHQIIWEYEHYRKGENPSGHSVTQRLEYWKTALAIFQENPVLGVGTGDIKKEFDEHYKNMNSPLDIKWRLRSHNQFFSIAVAFGSIGLLWFLVTLFYPLLKEKRWTDYFYSVFFIIALFSMFNEDTLETQVGATFFAFFNALFLFGKENEK